MTFNEKIISVCIVGMILLGGGVLIKGCFPGQSGFFSRWTGGSVKLPVPKDCARVLGMGKTGTTKYLSYVTTDGRVVLREYSDYGVLEATYALDGAKFTADGHRVVDRKAVEVDVR